MYYNTITSDVEANHSMTFYSFRNQPVQRISKLNSHDVSKTMYLRIHFAIFHWTFSSPGSYPVSAVDFYGNMSQNIAPICHLTTPSSTTWFWQTRAMTTTIFIAPTTGVYAFHFSVCVILSLEVTWNGNAIGSIFAEGSVYRKGYH